MTFSDYCFIQTWRDLTIYPDIGVLRYVQIYRDLLTLTLILKLFLDQYYNPLGLLQGTVLNNFSFNMMILLKSENIQRLFYTEITS